MFYMFAEFTRHVPMVTPGHYVTISDQLEVPASNRRCYRIYMDIHIYKGIIANLESLIYIYIFYIYIFIFKCIFHGLSQRCGWKTRIFFPLTCCNFGVVPSIAPGHWSLWRKMSSSRNLLCFMIIMNIGIMIIYWSFLWSSGLFQFGLVGIQGPSACLTRPKRIKDRNEFRHGNLIPRIWWPPNGSKVNPCSCVLVINSYPYIHIYP